MSATVRAAELQPGASFNVGGIRRTVTAVEAHDDGSVSVHYRPGLGLMHVSPDLQIRSVE